MTPSGASFLGDTSKTKALCVPAHRPDRRNSFKRLCNGHVRIRFAELGRSPSRLLQATSIGVCCREKAVGPHGARLLRESLLNPLGRSIVVALGKMGRPDPEHGVVVQRIKRAQPNGTLEVLNRAIWAEGIHVEVAAARPRPSRVRVNGKRPFDCGKPRIKLAN